MSPPIHEAALRLLARRAYSRRELAERLAKKEYPPAAVEVELERLERAGLLDEDELARSIRRDRLRQGKGRRAIAGELWRRGVEPATVARALAELAPEEAAEALAGSAAKAMAKHPRWRELPRERAKVVRYLLARGFDAAEVRRVLGRTLDEENDAAQTLDPGDP
ncbi:MAG: regulatory protein RecX [Thermoanaerobaculaceae bacterium]